MSAPHRILVVDDTRGIHETMRTVLAPQREVASALDQLEADLFGLEDEADNHDAPSFDLSHATQGKDALELVKTAVADENPYALAFVDMRMPPGWDGLRTIEELWAVDPELHVVICTAFSDHPWSVIRRRLGNTAQLLVLHKPFDAVELQQVAFTMTHKWASQRAEKELLERTLGGAVGVMGELLTVTAPSAAARAKSTHSLVSHAANELGLTHWVYPVAAGLSQVGCLMLPDEIVAHERSGRDLESSEQAMYRRHPKMGARLVSQIPRLQLAAKIIEQQMNPPNIDLDEVDESSERFVVAAGANLIAAAIEVDRILYTGVLPVEAVARCREQHWLQPKILDALAFYAPPQREKWVEQAVPLIQLKVGMVLQEPVTTPTGVMVCPAKTQITLPLLERLINFAVRVGITQEFRVKMPAPPEDKQS